MLLALSLTGAHAPDLGWLLYKNPTRAQKFELSFGNAYVFYTENSAERATACLLLDINPLDLVKGKSDNHTGLFDYVNDRPYVCSSFMSSAISRVFGSAMSGKCDTKQDIADMALPFEVTLTSLPARGKQDWIEKIFAPLGYTASFESSLLDDSFPQWGTSPYIDLTLKGTVRLRDLLRHLYVLIPVFDMQKHYWMGTSEVEKLLRNGEGWLESHPEKNFITGRYFRRNKQMAKEALERLDALVVSEAESEEETDENGEEIVQPEKVVRLNAARMEAVLNAIKQSGAKNIVDMGCGSGQLLRLLIKDGGFTRLAGMDVSPAALDKAEHKLRLDRMPEAQKKRISLFHGSLLYKDARLSGYCETSTGKFVKLDPIIAAAIKMLIFTGARCNEILTLKWSYVDSAKGLAFLPDSKTGAKVLHLPQPALALLESLPRINEYCFPGRNHKSHLVNIKDTWRRLLETAGLPHGPGGWRIHDLRHAFASYAVSSGKSLPIVGAMLGHTQPTTTQRYAHIAANPVASAAEDTAALLERDLNSGQGA